MTKQIKKKKSINKELPVDSKICLKTFIPINSRKLFNLLIWDKKGLIKEEEKYGLKISI